MKLYIDNAEQGLARRTSHPRFRELAPEDFFYDCTEEYSPFGNDDGADVLSSLEEWYEDGGGRPLAWLDELFAGWALPQPPDMDQLSDEALLEWLDLEKMNETWLASYANARIALAFGQLKITGRLDAAVGDSGLLGLRWKRLLNARARKVYPDWEYADEETARTDVMERVLLSAVQTK